MSDYIPFDVQMVILSKFPVKTLLQYRSVCKLWKACIDSYDFVRAYGFRSKANCPFFLTYKHNFEGYMCSMDENFTLSNVVSNLDFRQLIPVGTCEGLWCFSCLENTMLLIWNPSLKRSFPLAGMNNLPDSPKMLFGFGIQPDTLDPTIVKINYPLYGDGPWHVSVLTLGTGRWHQLNPNNLPRESIRLKRSGQVVIEGKIFWVGSEKFYPDDGISYKKYMLISFDIVTEQFQEIELPEEMLSAQYLPPYYIGQIEDRIIISGTFRFVEFAIIYAWELLVADGEVIWYRQLFTYTCPLQNNLKLIGLTANKQPIVETSFLNHSQQDLQILNPNYEVFQTIVFGANHSSIFIGPYKESLVLL